jgi:hypothetical protein
LPGEGRGGERQLFHTSEGQAPLGVGNDSGFSICAINIGTKGYPPSPLGESVLCNALVVAPSGQPLDTTTATSASASTHKGRPASAVALRRRPLGVGSGAVAHQ